MKARHLVCMAALMMPATPVLANDLSYTYVGVGFQATNQDNIDDSANSTRSSASGLDFSASWLFHDNLFALYEYRNNDFNRDTLDFQRSSVGLGFRESVGRDVDFVGVLRGVVNSYDDVNGDTQFDLVAGASVGLRTGVSENLDFGVHLDFVDEDSFEDEDTFVDYSKLRRDFSIRYEGLYTVAAGLGLTFGASINNDFRSISGGLRYSF